MAKSASLSLRNQASTALKSTVQTGEDISKQNGDSVGKAKNFAQSGSSEADVLLDAFIHRLKTVGYPPVAQTRELLEALVRAGRLDECVQWMERLLSKGKLSVKGAVDPTRMILACVHTVSLDLLLRYLALLPPTSGYYNRAMREYGQQGQLENVETVWKAMLARDCWVDSYCYRTLIDAYSRCKVPEKAMAAFFDLQRRKLEPNIFIYHSLMNAYVEEEPAQVWKLFKEMKAAGIAYDKVTVNILLKACSSSNQPELAWSIYNDLKNRMPLDIQTYTTLVQVFARAKEVDAAFTIKADMEAAGVAPSVVTWCALMGACTRIGQIDRAFAVFDEMLDQGVSPNTLCYNTLIDACAATGQERRALKLLAEMKAGGKRPHKGALSTCASLPRARSFEEGCKPSVATYNALLKLYEGAPELARGLVSQMRDEGLEPNARTYTALVDSYATAGDKWGAIGVFEEMRKVGLEADVVAWTAVMKACMIQGAVDKAFGYFEEMKQEGVKPTQIAYNTLLRVQPEWRLGYNVQRGLALYEEMRSAGYTPNEDGFRTLVDVWAEEQMSPHEESPPGGEETAGGALGSTRAVCLPPDPMFKEIVTSRESVMTVDLHRLTKAEARAAVLSFLRTLQLRHTQGCEVTGDLTIITGRGRNSEVQGQAVIREAVLHLLQDELGLEVVVPANWPITSHSQQSTQLEAELQMIPSTDAVNPPSNSQCTVEVKQPVPTECSTGNMDQDRTPPDEVERPSKVMRVGTGSVSRNVGRLVVPQGALIAWILRARSKRRRNAAGTAVLGVAEGVDMSDIVTG